MTSHLDGGTGIGVLLHHGPKEGVKKLNFSGGSRGGGGSLGEFSSPLIKILIFFSNYNIYP